MKAKKATPRRTGSVTIELGKDLSARMRKALVNAPADISAAVERAVAAAMDDYASPHTHHELLINWRNEWQLVLRFAPDRRFEVEDAAAMLSRAAGGLRLKVVDPDGTVRKLNTYGLFSRERAGLITSTAYSVR